MKAYRTIRQSASDAFVERKSRFIGHAASVASEAEAQAFITQISFEHKEASHNVYAYILREGNLSRCSDNGEPQGTAGVPVLDVLQKQGVTDVCVVVTRYFGGILLGTGGLVRAYSRGARLAIEAAGILEMVPCAEITVACDYSFYGKLSHLLPDFFVTVESSDFGERVILELLLREERLSGFQHALTELSNGQVEGFLRGRRFAHMAE